jgi:hypothetical protein
MACLNSEAMALIADALHDAGDVYEKLAGDETLPPRLRSQFSAQRHMALTLAELFECHPTISAEGVDQTDYRAMIWGGDG